MNKLMNMIIFGKGSIASGLIALFVVAAVALGCTCGKDFDLSNIGKDESNKTSSGDTKTSDDSVPSNSVVEGLVKDTTGQFAEAIDAEDFDDLYANASSDFRSTYTLEQTKDAFKSYINKKSLVVPILKKVADSDADFTTQPSIRTEKGIKILMANGKFPTKPYNVRFDYEYVMRGGEWKLLKLVVNIP